MRAFLDISLMVYDIFPKDDVKFILHSIMIEKKLINGLKTTNLTFLLFMIVTCLPPLLVQSTDRHKRKIMRVLPYLTSVMCVNLSFAMVLDF